MKEQNKNNYTKGREDGKKIILIGTYKGEQLSRWPGWYCWPIGADDFGPASDRCSSQALPDLSALKKINELWLFQGTKEQKTYKAKFVGIKTREELIHDYAYPATGKAHGERYLLFKTSFEYNSDNCLLDEAEKVIIRLKDFSSSPKIRKQLKEYLESPDRNNPELSKRLPSITTQLHPEQLHVCDVIVQSNFLDVLYGYDKKILEMNRLPKDVRTLRFIDLFAGIGGIREGFEQACDAKGLRSRCVFTSEIKPHAIDVLKQNHPEDYIHGDITTIDADSIPDFDILLAGFPCQAFSAAGKRHGFEDTRGTLFFDVARILKEKTPFGFVLENVEGLVNHDKRDKNAPYGNTLKVILETLEELGYFTSWRVLNAKDFGVPQERKRIYIIGTRKSAPSMMSFCKKTANVGSVLEHGLEPSRSKFINKLLSHYSVSDLYGKAVKDKRGGENNIHSWDIELKGKVSSQQKKLLNQMLKERRKHIWAEQYGIDWMDGMPLTLDMIRTFFDVDGLKEMLEDLAAKKYLVKEHPKRRVKAGNIFERIEDPTLPLGYNIVAGKMSFEVSKILSPEELAPTLVAMDMQHLYVVDGDGIRNLSLREGLNLFGYPKGFKFNVSKDLGYDLLGNTVVVPVIKEVACRLIDVYKKEKEIN